MDGAHLAFALLVFLNSSTATSTIRQPNQAPNPTPPVDLEASVSLVDRDVAYGGVDRGAPNRHERERDGRVHREGEVFGWHDGTIRLVGMLDTAGGCARPTGIKSKLVGETVYVLIEEAQSICPAIYTPELMYARISGLQPGRYFLRIHVGRTLALRAPGDGVDVPAPSAPR